MSRSEMAQDSAREQSAAVRSAIKTEAEHQRELHQLLEQIATDVTSLNEEHKATLQRLRREREALTSSLDEAHKSMSEDLKKAQGAAAKTRQELRTAIEDVRPTVWRIQAASQRISVMTMLSAAVAGILLGVICTVALAIWQPQLIEAVWQAAIRLGTAQP